MSGRLRASTSDSMLLLSRPQIRCRQGFGLLDQGTWRARTPVTGVTTLFTVLVLFKLLVSIPMDASSLSFSLYLYSGVLPSSEENKPASIILVNALYTMLRLRATDKPISSWSFVVGFLFQCARAQSSLGLWFL